MAAPVVRTVLFYGVWGGLLAATALACGCRTPETVESPRFDRMWAAAIGAATEYGFQVIELNETQGVITAARTGPGEDNALLRMYIYPSAAGYTVAVVVRSPETAALPPVVPPRTARREPLDRSSRYTRLDNAGPIRHFEEEERLLEGIRRRLAERAEKEK